MEINDTALEPDSPQPIELAHVLFTDLVAYSTLPMEEQSQYLREFQALVRATPHFRSAEQNRQIISLPTGDGMALVFFGDPIAPVQCALEIAAALQGKPHLKLRMGLNTGPVYRISDVNSNQNVSGAGINMAQRIMDAGDARHILLSKSAADVLSSLKTWSSQVHDLGEHAVKHGVSLHFFNLYTENLGNPELPSKMRKAAVKRPRKFPWRYAGIAAALVLVLTVGAGYFLVPASGARRKSVAILGFRNITGRPDTEWVATAIAEGLRAELGGSEKARTIADEEVAEMKRTLALPPMGSLGRASLAKLKDLGADIVILGGFIDNGSAAGGKIRLDVQIQDTSAGESVGSFTANSSEAEIGKLISETGTNLWSQLRLGADSRQKEQVDASRPNSDAAPLYSEGLTKLRQYDASGAQDYFEKAITVDPNFPFAHSALAECWSILGFDSNAEQEARRAFELSAKLPLEDRLSIEGRYREMAHEWDRAIATYAELFQHYPDNVDYGLKLAAAQRSGGKGKDARVTIAALRKLPKPERQDPRIDLEDAETSAALGDNGHAQTAANDAVEKAKARGARLLEGRALNWTCTSLRHLSQFDKAQTACEKAIKANSDVGDKLGMARAWNGLGSVLNARGDSEGARMKYERALQITSEIGAKRDMTGALGNLAMVLSAQGRLPEAEQRYRQTLSVQQEIGFRNEIPRTLNNLADVLHLEGNLAESQRVSEQAVVAARETGNDEILGLGLMNLGAVLLDRGDLTQAEKNLTDGLSVARKNKDNDLAALISAYLGKLFLTQGKLDQAATVCEEAAKLQRDSGDKQAAAATGVTLAQVRMAQKQFDAAEKTLRDAISGLSPDTNSTQDKHSSEEILARVLLAQAVLAQNRKSEADILMVPASGMVAAIPQPNTEFAPRIAAAQVSAALNPAAGSKSIAALREIAGQTTKAGLPGYELEARLAIGEIERLGGKTAEARKDLKLVEDEASRKGFVLFAKQAAAK